MTVTWPGAGKRTERGQLGHGVLFNDQGREGHAMHGIALYGMVLNVVLFNDQGRGRGMSEQGL